MTAKNKPTEMRFWQDPAYLKAIRESFGLSQRELARRTHVTRAVIANVETSVTPLTPKDALELYMLLDALGSENAGKAVRAICAVLRKSAQRELALVEAELSTLQKRRQKLLAQIAEIDSAPSLSREMRAGAKSNG